MFVFIAQWAIVTTIRAIRRPVRWLETSTAVSAHKWNPGSVKVTRNYAWVYVNNKLRVRVRAESKELRVRVRKIHV